MYKLIIIQLAMLLMKRQSYYRSIALITWSTASNSLKPKHIPITCVQASYLLLL